MVAMVGAKGLFAAQAARRWPLLSWLRFFLARSPAIQRGLCLGDAARLLDVLAERAR